jgi:ribonuclease-3 family protein
MEESIKNETGCTEVEQGILQCIERAFPGKKQDVRTYSPLALAYIGDGIYDLVIRTVIVEKANRPVNDLHRMVVRYVSANAQAKIAQALMEEFTEDELSVYRRGKNSKPHTTAKNASAGDYLKATGFEAVIGFLYLKGDIDRALTLIKLGIEKAGLSI